MTPDFLNFNNSNAEAEEEEEQWAKELKERMYKCHTPQNTTPKNCVWLNLTLDDETGDYIDRCYFAKLNDKQ